MIHETGSSEGIEYALVMTADSRLLPGVHAMLNASVYYGWHDKLEFHLLYWPGPEMHQFISDMKASGCYPNFRAINLAKMAKGQGPEEQGFKPVYYLKFYRSWYAGNLTEYDAVGFMDADMAIVGDISPYFKLAHEADRICMVGWRYNQQRVDSGWYAQYKIHGTSGCPFDPCATFFPPKTWGEHFTKIRYLGREVVRNSEMPTMNYMIIVDGLLEEIIRLPTVRWTQRNWGEIKTYWIDADIYGHHYFFVNFRDERLTRHVDLVKDKFLCHFNGDTVKDWDFNGWNMDGKDPLMNMLSIHGRWHFRATLQKKTAKGERLERPGALIQNQNIANIWEVFKFFNFDCYTRLEPWRSEWGSPDEYIHVPTGELRREKNG